MLLYSCSILFLCVLHLHALFMQRNVNETETTTENLILNRNANETETTTENLILNRNANETETTTEILILNENNNGNILDDNIDYLTFDYTQMNPEYTKEGYKIRGGDMIFEEDILRAQGRKGKIDTGCNRWREDFTARTGCLVLYVEPSTPYFWLIRNAMNILERETCCTFEKVSPDDPRQYIRFVESTGCWSYVGRLCTSQKNEIGLRSPGNGGHCYFLGIILHELLHALGIVHEQSRPDRDQHVIINYENIIPGFEHNFNIATNIDCCGIPYDYHSIMHYGRKDFSRNGQNTITTRNPDFQDVIGQRTGLSASDIEIINKMYGCNGARCRPETTTTTTTTESTTTTETTTTTPTTSTTTTETTTTTPTTTTTETTTTTPTTTTTETTTTTPTTTTTETTTTTTETTTTTPDTTITTTEITTTTSRPTCCHKRIILKRCHHHRRRRRPGHHRRRRPYQGHHLRIPMSHGKYLNNLNCTFDITTRRRADILFTTGPYDFGPGGFDYFQVGDLPKRSGRWWRSGYIAFNHHMPIRVVTNESGRYRGWIRGAVRLLC